MKITIWIHTVHIKLLNLFINGQEIDDSQEIHWLKYLSSVMETGNKFQYVQVTISYGDFKNLEKEYSSKDFD